MATSQADADPSWLNVPTTVLMQSGQWYTWSKTVANFEPELKKLLDFNEGWCKGANHACFIATGGCADAVNSIKCRDDQKLMNTATR